MPLWMKVQEDRTLSHLWFMFKVERGLIYAVSHSYLVGEASESNRGYSSTVANNIKSQTVHRILVRGTLEYGVEILVGF